MSGALGTASSGSFIACADPLASYRVLAFFLDSRSWLAENRVWEIPKYETSKVLVRLRLLSCKTGPARSAAYLEVKA